MFSKEFIEKFKEFKKSLIDTSDLFDELYTIEETKRDEMIMILSHLDSVYSYVNSISESINEEEKNKK